MKEDKKPFINVTKKGKNFSIENSEFVGDRPTINTDAENTKLKGIKHFIGKPSGRINWQKWGVIVAIIGVLVTVYFSQNTSIDQTVIDSPESINTVGQFGNNTIVIDNTYRRLTSDQELFLKNELRKSAGKVGFVSKIFDPEAANFASKLSNIFVDANWEVVGKLNPTLANSFDGDFVIFSKLELSTKADLVRIALSKVGLLYSSKLIPDNWVSGNFMEDTIYIVIDSQSL